MFTCLDLMLFSRRNLQCTSKLIMRLLNMKKWPSEQLLISRTSRRDLQQNDLEKKSSKRKTLKGVLEDEKLLRWRRLQDKWKLNPRKIKYALIRIQDILYSLRFKLQWPLCETFSSFNIHFSIFFALMLVIYIFL